MNRLFNTNFNYRTLDVMLLILRAGISALMLTHGLAKLNNLLDGGEIKFGDPIGIGVMPSLYLAIFSEVFCSIFLIIGLASRLALMPLIVTMLVALLVVHAEDPISAKEPALHYLLVYVFLLFTGPGGISFDKLISNKAIRARRGY